MKVLYVSKASVVPAYQGKLGALGAHVQVDAVIPARWGRDSASAALVHGARVRTARVLLHGHNHLHVYRDASAILESARPDLVHLDEEAYSAVTFQFARLCERARVPFVFFSWQNLDKRLPAPFGAMRRYVFAHAAAAIAGTERAAAVLRSAGLRREIAIIPQVGVDPERFRPSAAARAMARARFVVEDGVFVAGFAGRLVPEKGVDLLLDAVAALENVHVLVVGDGPERRRLERRARRLGILRRTWFTGRVGSLEMPLWMNAMDVLVLPSRTTRGWTEQFGRVLVEAMACGVPVIGAASGEIPAVLGRAGLTFTDGDSAMLAARLMELRDRPAIRAELAELGRDRVLERFTHDRIAHATADFYHSCRRLDRAMVSR